MGKFSIRVQILGIASVFVAALIAVSVVSWFAKADLTVNLKRTFLALEQEELLTEMQLALDDAESSLLQFALGKTSHWGIFTSKVDEFHGLVEMTQESFAQTDPEAGAALAAASERLMGFSGQFEQVRKEASAGNPDLITKTVQPALRRAGTQVKGFLSEARHKVAKLSHLAEESVDSMIVTVLSSSALAIVVSLIVAALFSRAFATAIRTAAQAVKGLTDGVYDQEICDRGRKDEVGAILCNLDALRSELKRAEDSTRQAKRENEQRVDLFQTLSYGMGQLRNGDLQAHIDAQDWEELGETYVTLCEDFNHLAKGMNGLVGSLRNSARTVESSAAELSDMSVDMTQRVETQAATLEQSANALDELSNSIQTAAESAQEADRMVEAGRTRAEEGGSVMERALEAMSSIASSSEEITKIIDVIDDIAFQTNLLALNAGVEAARAGETGKGFAVVAAEVRSLAQRAAESASAIKTLVLGSTVQVQDGERLVQETSATLDEIVQSVNEISGVVSEIAAGVTEQARGVKEISSGMGELEKMTHENTVMVNQAKESSRHLTGEATQLTGLLAKFSDDGAGVPVTEPSDPASEGLFIPDDYSGGQQDSIAQAEPVEFVSEDASESEPYVAPAPEPGVSDAAPVNFEDLSPVPEEPAVEELQEEERPAATHRPAPRGDWKDEYAAKESSAEEPFNPTSRQDERWEAF